ncbi:MAG: family 10 glycosylhydrolase, partial [Aquincola sp.]|nr:family 10 glycosylhydrolase [Aquincola sp.]
LAANHVAQRRPAWVRPYGDLLWLDPGEPEAMAHSLAVIADVTARYDVDGVQVDDYFYPYPLKPPGGGDDLPFPDEPAWNRARAVGVMLARDDWRRRNVDRFVQQMFERVRGIKPWVKVGISPFGLPRPDRRPPGIEGFSQYDRLYADVERWLAEGWLDYLAPQLYWAMEPRAQAFGALVEAWARSNARGRHLWPGLFTSAVARPPRQWTADELLAQLAHLRGQRAKAGGFIHFSMAALMDDRGGLASRLLAARPGAALVPASPWLGAARPAPPRLTRAAQQIRVQAAPGGEPARWLALWVRRGGAWRFAVRPADASSVVPAQDSGGALEALVATSVGRSGVESERVTLASLTDH